MKNYDYNTYKLSNGLRYICVSNDKFDTTCVCVGIKVGSINEDKNTNGISHLLEHMLFKANDTYTSKYDLYCNLDNIGAVYNAYTDRHLTNFYVKSHYSKLEKVIKIFGNLICRPKIDEKELEIEKNVVIEEIQSSRENPFDIVYNKFFRLAYPKQTIAQKISGPVSNIEKITKNDLLNFMKKFYTAENMVISICGKIENVKHIHRILEESDFSNLPHSKPIKLDKSIYIGYDDKTSIDFINQPILQMNLGLAFPTLGFYDNDKYVIELIDYILNGSMSSRLFMKLREKEGLVYGIGSNLVNYPTGGLYFIIVNFDNNPNNKYVKVIKSVIQEIEIIKKKLVNCDEIKRWKNYNKSLSLLSLEDSMEMADYYLKQFLFYNEIISHTDLLDIFNSITIDDIHRVANKLFDFNKMKIVLLGDINDKTNINKFIETIGNSLEKK